MSKEKRIEEMAREMCHLSAECETCQICNERYHGDDDDLCYFQCVAKEIINHGYRKQSENVIELPCNIGDSCYPLPRSRKPIVERKVSRITFSKRNVIIGYYENDGQYRPPLRTRVLGEDIFLTKEEAEAKMKGGGGDV